MTMTYKARLKLYNLLHWALRKFFDCPDNVASFSEVNSIIREVWNDMYENDELVRHEQ